MINKRIWRALLLPFVFTTALLAQTNPDWHRSFPAFKIAGNLYYVGTADLAVYLINTPQGNILINSDFPEDVLLIRRIGRLGIGDIISLVAASSPNSEDAFASCRHGISRLKKMTTIRKNEIYG